MTHPPFLDPAIPAGPIEARYALLINPFYPKDPNASFGKHVLTPTLALTSFAATTPDHWEVRYWDENLLDGRPPFAPMPEVVGITVHLTFAKRAFELAQWYRRRGSKVVLGGLHVLSCPGECAPHADALAVGDGVQLWPRILADAESGCLQPTYTATFESDYRQDPAPRRSILPRRSFLTTTSLIATRGCPAGWLSSDVAVQHFGDAVFAHGADDLLGDGAALEQQQGRDAANLEAAGGGGVVVHVQLAHFGFAGVFSGDGVDGRRHHLTRAAPLGPKVHQDRHGRAQYIGVEARVGEGKDVLRSHTSIIDDAPGGQDSPAGDQ
jgi:hypothetical protein